MICNVKCRQTTLTGSHNIILEDFSLSIRNTNRNFILILQNIFEMKINVRRIYYLLLWKTVWITKLFYDTEGIH